MTWQASYIVQSVSTGFENTSVCQGRMANPRPVATINKLTTGRIIQWQVLARTVGHGETGFLLRSSASGLRPVG